MLLNILHQIHSKNELYFWYVYYFLKHKRTYYNKSHIYIYIYIYIYILEC